MRILIAASFLLAGCATTPVNLSDRSPALTIDSAKRPQALANCIAEVMTNADVRDEGGGHYLVVRSNNFGAIGRWDVYPTANGSHAEWRRAGGLTTGGQAGRRCA
jgi:hypothetical protein